MTPGSNFKVYKHYYIPIHYSLYLMNNSWRSELVFNIVSQRLLAMYLLSDLL